HLRREQAGRDVAVAVDEEGRAGGGGGPGDVAVGERVAAPEGQLEEDAVLARGRGILGGDQAGVDQDVDQRAGDRGPVGACGGRLDRRLAVDDDELGAQLAGAVGGLGDDLGRQVGQLDADPDLDL